LKPKRKILPTNIKRLENRTRSLEKVLSEVAARCRGLHCNCRDHTDVHNADELEAILKIPCPEHGLRDLGSIFFRTQWLPLDQEFQHLCNCPPDLHRDFVAGKRPKPTDAEVKEQDRGDEERHALISAEQRKRDFVADRDKFSRLVDEHRRAIEEQREQMQKAKVSKSLQKLRHPEG
jgi:hypothetical protein